MALGSSTFQLAGGAVQDFFNAGAYGLKAEAEHLKAKGQKLEAGMYTSAAGLAGEQATFAESSTRIKEAQLDRSILKTEGMQRADVASSGFGDSGSALDLMRDSASQGALTKAVGQQQGIVEEDAFHQQQLAYNVMSAVSTLSAEASEKAAESDEKMVTASYIMGGIKGAAAIGTLFTGGDFSMPGLDPSAGVA